THRALVHEYASAIEALDLHEDDRPVHALPLYHSAQTHVFLLPYLAVGAENTIVDGPDPAVLFDLIEAGRADSLFAPPTVWIGLANHPEFASRDLSALRKAYYGASIMPVPVLEGLRGRLPGLRFYNCFGQSEIGPLATVLGPDEHEGRMDSCGRPVRHVEARVVDEDGKDVPDGTPGEIVYRSPQLCDGYWRKPEETEAAFRGGWFRSGDLAVRDAEGYLTIVDRVKDVITEDSAELRPDHPHVVRLEARPANQEGAGLVTLRDLVRQALRMRPDRLVVGEVRGGEAVDLLAALNTGHEGGSGTVHANTAADVPARLEALGTAAGLDRAALHSQLGAGLSVVLHLARDRDGRRRIAEAHVLERDRDGLVRTVPALRWGADGFVRERGWDRLRSLIGGGS
ncbi:ATPase, T2SS/T4P/T4SS family, partial [Streptomyces massasporeus]